MAGPGIAAWFSYSGGRVAEWCPAVFVATSPVVYGAGRPAALGWPTSTTGQPVSARGEIAELNLGSIRRSHS